MPETATPLLVVHRTPDRAPLVRRARLLALVGLAWHLGEAAVAIGAGVVASSVALVGFGADSLVEAVAGVVVLWRFAGARAGSGEAERRAQRLIGASFYAIALYVGVEATRSLIGGHEPDASWVGIGLSVVTLVAMPPLAAAKSRVADRLGSAAPRCAYLSAALLVGLLANAALGWWWADPLAALVVAGVAVREGRAAWRGDPGCADGCC